MLQCFSILLFCRGNCLVLLCNFFCCWVVFFLTLRCVYDYQQITININYKNYNFNGCVSSPVCACHFLALRLHFSHRTEHSLVWQINMQQCYKNQVRLIWGWVFTQSSNTLHSVCCTTLNLFPNLRLRMVASGYLERRPTCRLGNWLKMFFTLEWAECFFFHSDGQGKSFKNCKLC